MPKVPTEYVALVGSERPLLKNAILLKEAEPDEEITFTVHIRRNPDAQRLPDHEDWTQSSKLLTMAREEFAENHSASQSDVDAVYAFAQANNLKIGPSNLVRRTVSLSGTIGHISGAFSVEFNHYALDETKFRGRTGCIHVPAKLASIITGVFGLDNRRMAHRARAGRSLFQFTVRQLMTHYNFPNSKKGDGETIGIIAFAPSGYRPSDLKIFFDDLGVPVPQVTDVNINGAKNSPGDQEDDTEITMDIEIAGGTAPDANIAVYFATEDENGWVQAIKTAVHPDQGQPFPSVLSISWDWAEFAKSDQGYVWTPAAMQAVSETFQEAASLGITVFVAAGDYGTDCRVNDGKAHVFYPASDPWVVSCGGTECSMVNGEVVAEATWSPTGGGISDFFDPPEWQMTAVVPTSVNPGARKGRGIPDLCAAAAPGLQVVVGGETVDGGGTSQVAPLLAGLIAYLNSETKRRTAFLNPLLYRLGNTSLFRDINDAVANSSPYMKSDGQRGFSPGYTSGPGWDACTGWGCIDGTELLRALKER